jgi:hypothetical protein
MTQPDRVDNDREEDPELSGSEGYDGDDPPEEEEE